ncbi:MAG: inositol monophosphatase, partial [Acidobacteria bacterium]|nr:inositol monophosphatase [Acidobacteriota bacterium]
MSVDPAFLATAVEAVVRAGEIHLSKFRSGVRVDKKGAIDLVTEVDIEVERMFRAMVAERFPDHDVLAEEFGGTSSGASHRWVFDPLDGTTNFAHGLPIFCAALALEINGRAEVAAVYDANRQELFTAERGVGSWLNGEPLRVSSTTEIIDALLVTGFPYTVHQTPQRYLDVFGAFITRARAVRRLGSAAIDLCWTAAGRMDGFWEENLQPWDTMAAALILEEAGGRVTGMNG